MSKCILIVEDQADNRRILRDLFANAGYELIEAESGEEALSALATSRPDLILMDIQLPVMDGYETTRRIRSNPGAELDPHYCGDLLRFGGRRGQGIGDGLQCLHQQAFQSARAARQGEGILGVGPSSRMLPSVIGGPGWVLGLHQSSHRFMARTITMSAARITNPTSTSNDVNVMIAHLAHVAARRRRAGRVLRDHSMTSSARASNVGGTVRPSILAVWALMTSSNLLDCTAGRSAGFAPLRMRPV